MIALGLLLAFFTHLPSAQPVTTNYQLVFRQTVPYMYAQDELRLNAEDPTSDNYAILDELERFRREDGRLYFRMVWPGDDTVYEWSQTSNPVFESVEGYEAINVPFTGKYWGGLEPSTAALMDGSVNRGDWFYAIGSHGLWHGGIPSYAKSDSDNAYPQQAVELYVAGDNTLQCGSSVSGSTRGRPSQVGSPSGEVTYEFTAESSMTVNFDLCDSEFDTYIRIIDDSGNEVAGNDDHSRCGSRGFGWGSHVEILILAGRTYTVVVEGFATHEGDFQLDVTCTLDYFRTSCQTWEGARSECQANGGDLVSITSSEKNAAVTTFMQSFNDYGDCAGPYPWIGGYDCTSSGCTWVDGSAWSFAGPGWSRDDPYLHFYTNGNWGTWNSGGQAKGICEISRTEEPATSEQPEEPERDSEYFSVSGQCEVHGDCVSSSNYPEEHGDHESCTVNILKDASLTASEVFELERCCDHLIVAGVDSDFSIQVPNLVYEGQNITWVTDWSESKRGWQLCFADPSSSTAPPASPAFRLRGAMGTESVTINNGEISETIVLSQEWMDFDALSSTITIDFNNDNGPRDVYFESNVETSIIAERLWPNWNCDSENEGHHCQNVRDGRFAWGGTYLIAFGEEITATTNCRFHEGSVWAFCDDIELRDWTIGPEGADQALRNCNWYFTHGNGKDECQSGASVWSTTALAPEDGICVQIEFDLDCPYMELALEADGWVKEPCEYTGVCSGRWYGYADWIKTQIGADKCNTGSLSDVIYTPLCDNQIDSEQLNINFQPSGIDVPNGYLADYGETFGYRGNGFSYGWSCDLTEDSRDRFDRGTRDSTLIILDRDTSCGVDAVEWKIRVPNGYYQVIMTYSDPEHSISSTSGCTIQGQSASLAEDPVNYATKEMFVNVEDGEIIASGLFGGSSSRCSSFSSIQITPRDGTLPCEPSHEWSMICDDCSCETLDDISESAERIDTIDACKAYAENHGYDNISFQNGKCRVGYEMWCSHTEQKDGWETHKLTVKECPLDTTVWSNMNGFDSICNKSEHSIDVRVDQTFYNEDDKDYVHEEDCNTLCGSVGSLCLDGWKVGKNEMCPVDVAAETIIGCSSRNSGSFVCQCSIIDSDPPSQKSKVINYDDCTSAYSLTADAFNFDIEVPWPSECPANTAVVSVETRAVERSEKKWTIMGMQCCGLVDKVTDAQNCNRIPEIDFEKSKVPTLTGGGNWTAEEQWDAQCGPNGILLGIFDDDTKGDFDDIDAVKCCTLDTPFTSGEKIDHGDCAVVNLSPNSKSTCPLDYVMVGIYDDAVTQFERVRKMKCCRVLESILPTVSPTQMPTTDEPSQSPTQSPTTSIPSMSPTTEEPTVYPSQNPTTDRPTSTPSVSPSTGPTKFPSTSPSTDEPTLYPSYTPSLSPSTGPTKSPSTSPSTDEPTLYPSQNPTTDRPTSTPSVAPSTGPTKVPSTSPSTDEPTLYPSQNPTTDKPTSTPSVSPSTGPTKFPSTSPTTEEPTAFPSTAPTNAPTVCEPTCRSHTDQMMNILGRLLVYIDRTSDDPLKNELSAMILDFHSLQAQLEKRDDQKSTYTSVY